MINSPTPAMQDLARRLIALEAARERPDGPADAATRVCERLRAPLEKLMGPAGFAALLSRATAMARREVPPPGPAAGLQDLSGGRGENALRYPDVEAAALTHLLGLLATFIGEPLTTALVREAWSDANEGGFGPKIGEGS